MSSRRHANRAKRTKGLVGTSADGGLEFLVVVSAAKVVAAVGADQLALVACQPVRARRTDLAMMVYGWLVGGSCYRGANHTTL
jgi:hypothetical protein